MSHRTLSPFANRACSAIAIFTLASWTLIAATFLAWAPARDALGLGLSAAAANVLPRTGGHEHPAGAAIELASSTAAGFSYGRGEDETAFSWNVSDGDEAVILDGRASRRLRDGGARGEPLFEFREDGEWYVVRDPALVEEARRAAAPLREVGREMGRVGGEMGRHGAAMGRIGGRIGALGARIGLLEARLARSTSARSVATIRAQADQLRAELSRLQDDLSRRQSSHASQQRELSRRMSELSERHQRVLREVRAEIRELARRALREGKAERPHANA
jgi:gas vesicle protein